MSAAPKVRIEIARRAGFGGSHYARVFVDGQLMNGLKAVSFEVAEGGVAHVMLRIEAAEIEIEADDPIIMRTDDGVPF